MVFEQFCLASCIDMVRHSIGFVLSVAYPHIILLSFSRASITPCLPSRLCSVFGQCSHSSLSLPSRSVSSVTPYLYCSAYVFEARLVPSLNDAPLHFCLALVSIFTLTLSTSDSPDRSSFVRLFCLLSSLSQSPHRVAICSFVA